MSSLDRCTIVVTGATGNNAFKAVLPGIAALYRDTCLGVKAGIHLETKIVLVARQGYDSPDAEQRKCAFFNENRHGSSLADRLLTKEFRGDRAMLMRFIAQCEYVFVKDAGSESDFRAVIRRVEELEPTPSERRIVWFLNQDPKLNRANACFIGRARLVPRDWVEGGSTYEKLLIEKPLGYDLEDAGDFINEVYEHFGRQALYFVDHYLGKSFTSCFKDMLSATRFRLNQMTVDWVLIMLAEKEHINGRAAYYDGSGALRDMGQNHVLQLLALLCMDRPDMEEGDDRQAFLEARAKVLRNTRALDPNEVIRGQYAGYRDEKGVLPESVTETAFGMRLAVDLPRWSGVPIVAISGKSFPWSSKKIVIRFKPVKSYHDGQLLPPNVVVFNWDPEPGMYQRYSLTAGEKVVTKDHWWDFGGDLSKESDSYPRLIRNCVRGDRFVFPSAEEILESWRICEPALSHWKTVGGNGLLSYQQNSAPAEFGRLFPGLPASMRWDHPDWIVGGR